ncbi:hypothetical protein NXY00_16590 [Bacteroides sp. BFG-551]|nr:hypothetical protein [Bacteroides sp. BFG-551]
MWEFWYRNKDVDETATLYASIHLNDIISIAIESGKVALLKTQEITKWFERYRDQQAPSGYMPEYGDDYFFAYNNWILVFEKMARLTGDASYRKAAWKLFTIGYPNRRRRSILLRDGIYVRLVTGQRWQKRLCYLLLRGKRNHRLACLW